MDLRKLTDPLDPSHAGPYAHGGARALVAMHERSLREFVLAWRAAKERGVELPSTDDESYRSLEHLLAHVLGAAGGYLRWLCEVLELSDPGVREVPGLEVIAAEADAYVEHLVERWSVPFRQVDEKTFDHRSAPARWGPPYCVDGMFEHAVMHPLRHTLQLNGLGIS